MNLFSKHQPPTPKRRQMADNQRKATNDRKRREKSIFAKKAL
jgi:hypothetical protein